MSDETKTGRPGRQDAVTVWAVRLGHETEGRKGTLRLDGRDLAFETENASGERRIPLASIARVKANVGSPVLLVTHRDPGAKATTTAFYFSQPPPLARKGPEPASTEFEPPPILFSGQSPGQVKRRRARVTGMASLMGWNRLKKAEVRAWRDRIRDAMRTPG